MKQRFIVAVLAALTAAGCATTPQQAELKARNARLQDELSASREQVKRLTASEEMLTKEVTYLQYVNRVLEKEKLVRVGDAEQLREETREFIRDQMQSVREFARREGLLNYLGSELTERTMVRGEDQLLLDLRHRIPSDGTLLEGRVFLAEPAPFAFVLAREIQDQFVIVWKSDTYTTISNGLQEITFDIPVSAQADDCVGIYFPQAVQAPSGLRAALR